jgi:hypothetical protein
VGRDQRNLEPVTDQEISGANRSWRYGLVVTHPSRRSGEMAPGHSDQLIERGPEGRAKLPPSGKSVAWTSLVLRRRAPQPTDTGPLLLSSYPCPRRLLQPRTSRRPGCVRTPSRPGGVARRTGSLPRSPTANQDGCCAVGGNPLRPRAAGADGQPQASGRGSLAGGRPAGPPVRRCCSFTGAAAAEPGRCRRPGRRRRRRPVLWSPRPDRREPRRREHRPRFAELETSAGPA